MSSRMDFKFPESQAKEAKLYVPNEYNPYQNESTRGKCYLKFNKDHNVLILVQDDTEETLDMFDIDDMIGASVDFDLHGSEKPRISKAVDGTAAEEDSSSAQPKNAPQSSILSDTQATAKLNLFMYPRMDPSEKPFFTHCTNTRTRKPVTEFKSNMESSKLLHRYSRHLTFQTAPSEDLSNIVVLVDAIRRLARPETTDKTDKLLVVVNPFSGRKKGKEIYETTVAPMLTQAGIDFDTIITTHAGHAEEAMLPKDGASDGFSDISNYDGLVAIGGDGSIYEVLQGIRKRSDSHTILKKIKIGHVGAGTSNGLSASLAHASQEYTTATDYTFLVAKGNTVPMDLSNYETTAGKYLSFLTFTWSLIADIDIESEVLRWMGWIRNEIYTVWRLLFLRQYRGKITYLPPSAGKLTEMPPLSEVLHEKDGWISFEDNFCLLWVSQVTHAGETMLNHPQCKPNDGLFHIFLIRSGISRFRLLMLLLGLESGSHVKMNEAEFIDCTAYRFEPITKGSYNDLDGEVIESGPIQGIVLQGATRAYCNVAKEPVI